MKEIELIQLIADNLSSNTMNKVFQHIAPECVYISSGEQRATGKEEVCDFFMRRKEAIAQHKVACFAFPAIVEKSEEDAIPVGTHCAALAQYDQYNCVGFMTIQTNKLELITQFNFNTTPAVRFKTSASGKFNIERVPKDAHDAISYRVFAFGILDEHVRPSRHVQRYDEFEEYIQREIPYIMYHVIDDFEQQLSNIAGYLYTAAMSSAVAQERGVLLVRFDETKSANYKPPNVDDKYQQWINDGFETGKLLFRGYNEYAQLRHPDDRTLNEQLVQSFRDLLLYASIQANKDMDIGKV